VFQVGIGLAISAVKARGSRRNPTESNGAGPVKLGLDKAGEGNGLASLLELLGEHGERNGSVDGGGAICGNADVCRGGPFSLAVAGAQFPIPGGPGVRDGLLERAGLVLLADILAFCDDLGPHLFGAPYESIFGGDDAVAFGVLGYKNSPVLRLPRFGNACKGWEGRFHSMYIEWAV